MLCTGVLISPTAVATAGHCTDIALSNGGTVQVTFDPAPTASSTFYLAKELITAPEFTFDLPNQGTPHVPPDLGVIILAKKVTGITPAPLPAIGTLDTVNRRTTVFQAVGYGTNTFEGNTPQSRPVRNVADVKLATGEGGVGPLTARFGSDSTATCFGDSGGPFFLGATAVAIQSYVTSNRCQSWGYATRLDTQYAHDFYAPYL